MPDSGQPEHIKPGDPIRAKWLNKVAGGSVQRASVARGTVNRSGTSIAIAPVKTPRNALKLYVATADALGGTITAKPVDSSGNATGNEITLVVL